MANLPFPWLALGLGLLVAFGLTGSGALGPAEAYRLPVLTLLIVNEFGFFVTAIGAGIGINTLLARGMQRGLLLSVLGCALLAAVFLYLGIRLWPGGFSL
ncbi:MAG TPA: hypothetical protein VM011_02240 [Gammaproteobacteria bacterium]|nr:hypothetical protein [Gammaproteobacteria bacterium]